MVSTQQITSFLDTNRHVGILFLRFFVGGRLLYGVLDNVMSWERMLEFAGFLEVNHFPIPVASAIASVYLQFFCALLILIGFKVRLAAFLLSLNFIVALVFVHFRAGDTIEGMTPALAMFFGCLTLLFTGSGKKLR